ncbi:MAG: VOC family protein [Spirochaetales bacterium]|jgi:catechol 2,3-dioxygenase-like lactoylglutathione lyase family enzyme|nr:VOC family protein [Spirochaetales bacterium]
MSVSKIVSKHSPIYHLGFFVEDAMAFARQHHDLYGSGPFIVMENFPIEHIFRGKEMTIMITVVEGWWKDLSIEIIQQHTEGPSYFKENGRYGFHHICFSVSDVPAACKEFEAAGRSIQVTSFDRPTPYAFIDAREQSGYYIELIPTVDPLSQIVKKWAADWDGETKLFRTLEDARKG